MEINLLLSIYLLLDIIKILHFSGLQWMQSAGPTAAAAADARLPLERQQKSK